MKYFVTSDLHSFCAPLKIALAASGFDLNNKDHTLVILGDLFDRGARTRDLYEFLSSIPSERLIVVKGNHEYLLDNLLGSDFPNYSDFQNGTVRTCCQMAYKRASYISNLEDDLYIDYMSIQSKAYNYVLSVVGLEDGKPDTSYEEEAKKRWKALVKKVKKSDIYKRFKGLNWKDYWETDNFIGVHSFVPVRFKNEPLNKKQKTSLTYHGAIDKMEADPDWRNADLEGWEAATWGCPYTLLDAGLYAGNKTIICGHWQTAAFHDHYKDLKGIDRIEKRHSIYYDDKIIALDAATAVSHTTNVLIIEENGSCSILDNKNNLKKIR